MIDHWVFIREGIVGFENFTPGLYKAHLNDDDMNYQDKERLAFVFSVMKRIKNQTVIT